MSLRVVAATGPAADCSHADYQAVITTTAKLLGWNFIHVRKSIGKGHRWQTTTNRDGWPDLFLWHSDHGFAAIEVKVGKDKATDEQRAVLVELAAAGARVAIAYPADWPLVVALLSGIR